MRPDDYYIEDVYKQSLADMLTHLSIFHVNSTLDINVQLNLLNDLYHIQYKSMGIHDFISTLHEHNTILYDLFVNQPWVVKLCLMENINIGLSLAVTEMGNLALSVNHRL